MKKLVSLSVFALALITFGCTGGGEKKAADKAETAEKTGVRTVHVYGIDRMEYVVKEKAPGLKVGDKVTINGEEYYLLEGMTAKAGEKIKLKLTTISKLPAQAMSHNWVLMSRDADVEAFVNASARAKENGYVAPDMENLVLQKTELVAGGETTEITFTAPEQKGDYEYLCSFPGHYSGGMKGILTVE